MFLLFHSHRQANEPRRAAIRPGQWGHANGEQEEEGSGDGPPHPQSGSLPPFPLPLLPLCCAGCWSEGFSLAWADVVTGRLESSGDDECITAQRSVGQAQHRGFPPSIWFTLHHLLVLISPKIWGGTRDAVALHILRETAHFHAIGSNARQDNLV